MKKYFDIKPSNQFIKRKIPVGGLLYDADLILEADRIIDLSQMIIVNQDNIGKILSNAFGELGEKLRKQYE